MEEQVVYKKASWFKPHLLNSKYFDDDDDDDFERITNSIATKGEPNTPLLVAPDGTIISGHRRHRACVKLGIEFIPCIIREELADENEQVSQLISSNFSRSKRNESKFREALKAYKDLHGRGHGGNRKSRGQNAHLKTEKEMAKEFGLSIDEFRRRLRIAEKLPLEITNLLDNGEITQATALLLCRLSLEEQIKLVSGLEIGNEKNPINEQLKSVLAEKEKIKKAYDEMKRATKNQIERQATEINELKNREPEQVEVEVPPADYEDSKLLKERVTALEAQLEAASKSMVAAIKENLLAKDDSSSYLVSCTIENVPDINEIDSPEERNDLLEANGDLILSAIPCVNSHMRLKYRILERALELTDEKNNLLVSPEDYKRFICEYDGANYQKLVTRIQKYKTHKT